MPCERRCFSFIDRYLSPRIVRAVPVADVICVESHIKSEKDNFLNTKVNCHTDGSGATVTVPTDSGGVVADTSSLLLVLSQVFDTFTLIDGLIRKSVTAGHL